jgi:gas vesicle protein
MDIDQLPSRISEGVEGLRDRTAGAIAPDGTPSATRAVAKLKDRIDGVEERLSGQLAAATATLTAATNGLDDRLDDLVATGRRTTFPRKLFWLLLGAAMGAGAAYLADPDRGKSRRAQLSDQAGARAREVRDEVSTRAKLAADQVKGEIAETVQEVRPERVTDDPELLTQRIKSEVLGHRDDVSAVVLRVDAPGVVAVKGTVPDANAERELLAEVAAVDGVLDVRSELQLQH